MDLKTITGLAQDSLAHNSSVQSRIGFCWTWKLSFPMNGSKTHLWLGLGGRWQTGDDQHIWHCPPKRLWTSHIRVYLHIPKQANSSRGWHGCSDPVNPRISMPTTTTTITTTATTTTTMTASTTTTTTSTTTTTASTTTTYCKPLLMSFQQRPTPSPCRCGRWSLEPGWSWLSASRPPGSWRSRSP